VRRFTQLFERLDASNSTQKKVEALVGYFDGVDPRSGAWALAALMGRTLVRGTPSRLLRGWAAERTATLGAAIRRVLFLHKFRDDYRVHLLIRVCLLFVNSLSSMVVSHRAVVGPAECENSSILPDHR